MKKSATEEGKVGGVGWGRPKWIRARLWKQIHQEWTSYGLKRDLTVPHITPAARIPLSIREIQDRDIPHLLGLESLFTARKERLEVANRLAHLAERIPTCYVAVDCHQDRACFMQWLMTHEHNEAIRRFFRGRFPALSADEALLENAYTPPQYRGLGIMAYAMSAIAERALDLGRRYVITFVLQDNPASLKGCAKAGFYPFTIRRDSHLLFHLIRRREFLPLPQSTAQGDL
jgi:hypothetical protein